MASRLHAEALNSHGLQISGSGEVDLENVWHQQLALKPPSSPLSGRMAGYEVEAILAAFNSNPTHFSYH
jgi:hypothetical protein